MIQRQLIRTLRPLQRPKSSSPCLSCTCRCGAQFPNSSQPQYEQQQRRTYRRAPSTLALQNSRGSVPLTPAEARAEKARRSYNSSWLWRQCQHMAETGIISASGDAAFQFLDAFAVAMKESRGQNAVQPERFIKLLNDFGIDVEDAERLGRVLLGDDEAESIYRGKKLLYTLSRAGYVESTIRIMGHAVLEAKHRPQVLGSREIAWSREHLTKVANEPETMNYRAMVLEGKIALQMKNEEYAIEMFNKAMAAAVAASEELLKNPIAKQLGTRIRSDPLELTAPWHELMQVHNYRTQYKGMNERAECEAAMAIGCEQDDPLAHKFAADYLKRFERNEYGEAAHIGTSDWLYHITKAASSCVPQAAHELGVFYAESGWKYIEDEPPDHVKPTPFDSYPAERQSTFWDSTLHVLGLKPGQTNPQEKMFHGASFPHTATERLKMAIRWLELAAENCYAPSFMMLARLYNRKTLWAQADAPKEALELSKERYEFASKADFEAGEPIPRGTTETEKEDPPNPLYDIEKAKIYLRSVFDAHEAHLYGDRMRKKYARERVRFHVPRYVDDDQALETNVMIKKGGLPERLGKWFKFSEVREMNGEVVEGLWEEAKEMCEEEGWELVDEEGGLVFRSGVGVGEKK